jgi:FixJ family two-component response regulator
VTDHDLQATVIVVDDDPSIRRALRRALTAVGYAVRLFTSADEFVAAGPVQRPACLVLDVRMPGKTGFDLWETLVARGTDLPVIFISGHDDPASELKAAKVGAVRFLAKPFDIEALLEAVEQAIYLDVTRGTDTREGSK